MRFLTRGCFAFILLFAICNQSYSQMDVFLDFDAAWQSNLNSLASSNGLTTFSAAEISTIESIIESELNTQYSDFLLNFSTTSPGGTFSTIDFGATGSSALGTAPLDYFNVSASQTANMFITSFGFIINEFSGSTDRSTQIDQLSVAIAGTAGHELGHSIGLHHHHAYATAGIDPTNYGGTGGLQNQHLIATGSTGLNEVGRETSRDLSQWSQLIVESAGGLDMALHGVTGTALASTVLFETNHFSFGDVGDTTMTADALVDIALPISGYDHAVHAFSAIDSADDADVFALEVDGPALVTAEVVHRSRWGSSLDSMLEIIDTDGTTILDQPKRSYEPEQFGSSIFDPKPVA